MPRACLSVSFIPLFRETIEGYGRQSGQRMGQVYRRIIDGMIGESRPQENNFSKK